MLLHNARKMLRVEIVDKNINFCERNSENVFIANPNWPQIQLERRTCIQRLADPTKVQDENFNSIWKLPRKGQVGISQLDL